MIPIRDTIKAERAPVVTLILIAANAAVFLLELSSGPDLARHVRTFGLVPNRELTILTQAPWRVTDWLRPFLTSMFMHGGWLHFLGNMWYLWIFGDNVEDRMGRGRFLFFYLTCGFLAAVTQTLFSPNSSVPVIGASGAIAGVLGAYFVLFPHARVVTLIPIFIFLYFVRIRAIYFLGFWFLEQIWLGTLSMSTVGGRVTSVAWWAHTGGFLAGLLFARTIKKRYKRRVYWDAFD